MRSPLLTRLLLGALALTLVGCAAQPAAPADDAPAADAGPRTVTHEMGTAEVPAAPERVVALDEYAAMNAYALGVEPIEVFGSFGSEISATILGEAGVTYTPSPTLFQAAPIEQIAALNPDLVIVSGGQQLEEIYRLVSEFAPVVVIPYYGATWQDALATTGATFGLEDQAAALTTTLEERIAGVAGDGRSISMVGSSGGMLFAPGTLTPVTAVLQDAGFTRPVDQQGAGDAGGFAQVIPLSAENLGNQEADIVVVPQGVYYDAAAVRSTPTFASLPAVAEGRVLDVDGDMWFGNFAFAIDWIVTDLESLVAGGGQETLGTPAQAAERWDAFLATTGG